MSLYRSRKSNGEGRKVFSVNEVQTFKVQRPKIQRTERTPAIGVDQVAIQSQEQRKLPQELKELVEKVAASPHRVPQITNFLFDAFNVIRTHTYG